MGTEFQFYTMKKALEVDGGDGCTTFHITIDLKMVKMVNCVMFILPH